MRKNFLMPFGYLIAVLLLLNGPLYGSQGSHEGHSPKGTQTESGSVLKKDLTLDNIKVKIELVTMEAYMDAMGQEMKHNMPMKHEMPMMGIHTHGKIVHDPSHRNLTHHLIVEVIDTKTDKIVKDAQVDIRLTYPKGQEKGL